MNRRILAFFLVVLCLFVFAGCGSEEANQASAQESAVMLDVGMMGTSVKPVGVLVADALGYFEEEGVQVNFEKVSSMNDAYLATSTGALDVYLFSSTAAATFISQGTTTLRVFGGTVSEGSEIMAAKNSAITLQSAEDFKGLTVGCFMAETGQMVLKNYLMEQGLSLGAPGEGADVAFVYYSDTSSGIEACKNGEYDLVITNSSLGYYADKFEVEVVAEVRDFVPVYPCCRQTCNQTTYEKEFEALVRFEVANLRGYAYALENPEATLDILQNYSGEDRDFLKAQIYGTDNYTPAMRLSLDPDRDACVAFYEAMMNVGEITDTIEVNWTDYVVTDVYETALTRLLERDAGNGLWRELQAYFEEHNVL